MQQVANQMKLIFSEYGWPETIVSDKRPCYSAETFTKLMTDYSVNHITSSPHYPQLNGLAEKYVQIVKNLFYKAQEEGTDLYKSMMIYRNTLLSNRLQSPMQILQSQTARTQLPMSNFGKSTTWTRIRAIENEQQEWTFAPTWLTYRSKCYVSKPCKQKMVSSHNHKSLPLA